MKKLVPFVTVVCIIIGVLLLFSNKKESTNHVVYDYYFTSYEVQNDDTLWTLYDKICQEYPDTKNVVDKRHWISMVGETNHIDPGRITSGKYVILHYYKFNPSAGVGKII